MEQATPGIHSITLKPNAFLRIQQAASKALTGGFETIFWIFSQSFGLRLIIRIP